MRALAYLLGGFAMLSTVGCWIAAAWVEPTHTQDALFFTGLLVGLVFGAAATLLWLAEDERR